MATRAVPAPLAQLPNALTLVRLALIPVFVALVLSSDAGHSWPAAIVFGVAAITDQVDGFLARRWRGESRVRYEGDPRARPLLSGTAAHPLPEAGLPALGALCVPRPDLRFVPPH